MCCAFMLFVYKCVGVGGGGNSCDDVVVVIDSSSKRTVEERSKEEKEKWEKELFLHANATNNVRWGCIF